MLSLFCLIKNNISDNIIINIYGVKGDSYVRHFTLYC